MAILMPVHPDAQSESTPDNEVLTRALRPWHSRLVMQYVLRWTRGGILAGLIFASLVLIISRLVPWGAAPYWAGGLALVALLATFTMALWLRPSIEGAAHIVDSRLQLQDRLGTAWEMRDQASTLAVLQRRDALQQLKQHTPAATFSFRPHRSTLLASLIALLVLALLIVLPNPMSAVVKQQEAFQARVAQQVKAINKVRQDLAQQSGLTPSQKKQIDQILQNLQNQLQNAKNENQAQQDIANAQSQLNQLRDPQAANKLQGQLGAGSSLQGSSNQNLQAVGKALSNGDNKALSKALQNLANQAGQLPPDQRSQLSQQIEQAANQSGQNPSLSSSLQQLSKAVADGNQNDINAASNAVSSAAQQDTSTQTHEQSIDQATQSLQQAANSLASSTDTSNQQGQGQQVQGQQGQQGQNGQGQQGQGQNQGQGQGQSQGQGQGGQGTGGQNGSNGAGKQQGKLEQVTVPGQTSSGASTQSNDNSGGAIQQGSSVPYNQVLQQYSQQAYNAIDSSNAPPDEQDLVHNYFDALEGQQ
jgi:hypothetical protein